MKIKKYILAFISLAIIAILIVIAIYYLQKSRTPNTYDQLTNLSDEQLAKLDIALVNLLCAEGLPGSESLNIEKCLITLDEWANMAKKDFNLRAYQFPLKKEKYDNLLAKFKVVNLGLMLKNDLKCGYNMDLVKSGAMADIKSSRFFKNSKDIFIHGFVDRSTGSCSSLPVLMVAVGRRCGYPLFLATSKGHLFCRWDDGIECFNIEMSCPGVDCPPDSHYKKWPYPCTEQEIKDEKYLKNLTPREEFGAFCSIRAGCLIEHKRYKETLNAYLLALNAFPESKYIPKNINYFNNLK